MDIMMPEMDGLTPAEYIRDELVSDVPIYALTANAGKDNNGNLVFIPNAIIGSIPSYSVMDLSLKYDLGTIRFEGGVSNLTNQSYFTRRATGYPGPGIIPSAIRNYYFTIQLKI